MWKVFPGIALCALLGVSSALVLGACIKPVGVDSFLNDERVQNIIRTGGEIEITFEDEDLPPELAGAVKEAFEDGDPELLFTFIKVPVGDDEFIITVSNASDYESFGWFFNSLVPLPEADPETGATFKLDDWIQEMGITPMVGGCYPACVVGKTNEGKYYSTDFFILFVIDE
jgi:hypothetical protein